MKINITCDRCECVIEGILDAVPLSGYPSRVTGGYYDVTSGYWNKFAKEGESNVCDSCMHSDENYIHCHGRGI